MIVTLHIVKRKRERAREREREKREKEEGERAGKRSLSDHDFGHR